MKKMFNDILFYGELTTCRDETAFINKYKSNYYQIDYNIANYLIREDIIELDSGNWDTGERHYKLDVWDNDLVPIPNSVLDRIKYLKQKINLSRIESVKNEMLKDIAEIELRYSRAIKLKKLNKYV